MVFALVLGYFGSRFGQMQKGIDFPDFYAAARMVQAGSGQQLYEPAAQRQFQAQYSGRIGTYFIHPPFETLLYFPFAVFPLLPAYVLWQAFNLVLLAFTARVLTQELLPGRDWRTVAAPSLVFVPVLLTLLQGQDSIVLLFCLVLAYKELRRKHEFAAGALLACGLFKFHFVMVVFILLALRRCRSFAVGFASVALVLSLISAAVAGAAWLSSYARFLYRVTELPMAGIHPGAMANVRGLINLGIAASASAQFALTIALSTLLLGWAIWRSYTALARTEDTLDLQYANAVLVALLIAYHVSPHDLSLLLLPLAFVFRGAARAWWKSGQVIQVSAAVLLLLPPLHLWLLRERAYGWMGILVLALLGCNHLLPPKTIRAEAVAAARQKLRDAC